MTTKLKGEKLKTEAEAKRISDNAEIDSVDSLICAWGTHMLMRFSYPHAVFYANARGLRERTESKTTIREKMA